MDKRSALKSIIASLLFAVPAAHAAVLDFEDFGTVDFEHGTVVNLQYSPLVTISADNFTNDVDMAVVFDSNESPTRDDDLEAPFYPTQADKDAGTNPFYPGNILIIQENDNGDDCEVKVGGICDDPDDEGTRITDQPTGVITFEFSQAIELLSLDFFDVENEENGSGDKNRIDVWDFDTNVVTKVGNTPDTGGDNLWQQILFDSSTDPALKNIGRIDVYFAGSGALDNLTYKVVPVPAAVWLFGTALLGFIGFSRRTSI